MRFLTAFFVFCPYLRRDEAEAICIQSIANPTTMSNVYPQKYMKLNCYNKGGEITLEPDSTSSPQAEPAV